jgi:hypothetical protein
MLVEFSRPSILDWATTCLEEQERQGHGKSLFNLALGQIITHLDREALLDSSLYRSALHDHLSGHPSKDVIMSYFPSYQLSTMRTTHRSRSTRRSFFPFFLSTRARERICG